MSIKKVALVTMTAVAFSAASVSAVMAQETGGSVVSNPPASVVDQALQAVASMGIGQAVVLTIATVGLGKFLVTVMGKDDDGNTVTTTITTTSST